MEFILYMNDYWIVSYKIWFFYVDLKKKSIIRRVIDSMLDLSAVERGFDIRSCQTNDYEIGIFCFSSKHAVLRGKSKDWLAQNQDNVTEWNYMSNCRLLFQWAKTIKIQLRVLVLYIIISSNVTWSRHDIAEKIALLAINNNHLLNQFIIMITLL